MNADIFLICLIVFFGPVFASRVLGSASGARQNFDCLRTPPHLPIADDERIRAQCASVAYWPGRANMQMLHIGLRSCFLSVQRGEKDCD